MIPYNFQAPSFDIDSAEYRDFARRERFAYCEQQIDEPVRSKHWIAIRLAVLGIVLVPIAFALVA